MRSSTPSSWSASYDAAHAREYGISIRYMRRLGGAEKLAAMDASARRVLIGPKQYGFAELHKKPFATKRRYELKEKA